MKGPKRVSAKLEYDTCLDCEYCQKEMIHSGKEPFYEYWCNHPEFKPHREYIEEFFDGIIIVPHWCPLLASNSGINPHAKHTK